MTDAAKLAQVKRTVSTRLLNEKGVSGVGIRGDSLVVYLATGDPHVRQHAEQMARKIAPTTPVEFEVAGEFRKQ